MERGVEVEVVAEERRDPDPGSIYIWVRQRWSISPDRIQREWKYASRMNTEDLQVDMVVSVRFLYPGGPKGKARRVGIT